MIDLITNILLSIMHTFLFSSIFFCILIELSFYLKTKYIDIDNKNKHGNMLLD